MRPGDCSPRSNGLSLTRLAQFRIFELFLLAVPPGNVPSVDTPAHTPFGGYLLLGSGRIGKTLDSGSRGRRFESCLPSHLLLSLSSPPLMPFRRTFDAPLLLAFCDCSLLTPSAKK